MKNLSYGKEARPTPIIVLGWFSADIIKRTLISINLMEGIKPEIYFVENKSVNSNKIKKIIESTPNIKGYIQYKENFAANIWKTTLEYFFDKIDSEYVTLTDGDYMYGCNSMLNQYKYLDSQKDIGIISQRRSLVGVNSYWRELIVQYWNGGIINGEETDVYSRNIRNGFLLTTAKKSDWQTYIDTINAKTLKIETHAFGNPRAREYRCPLFFDTDMYNFFETVLGKKSIKIKIDPSYHLTDEEHNDPDSEYNKAKGQFGYESSWSTYQNDPDFYHNKFYPDGSLKYKVII